VSRRDDERTSQPSKSPEGHEKFKSGCKRSPHVDIDGHFLFANSRQNNSTIISVSTTPRLRDAVQAIRATLVPSIGDASHQELRELVSGLRDGTITIRGLVNHPHMASKTISHRLYDKDFKIGVPRCGPSTASLTPKFSAAHTTSETSRTCGAGKIMLLNPNPLQEHTRPSAPAGRSMRATALFDSRSDNCLWHTDLHLLARLLTTSGVISICMRFPRPSSRECCDTQWPPNVPTTNRPGNFSARNDGFRHSRRKATVIHPDIPSGKE
jgi:hypothetical protein